MGFLVLFLTYLPATLYGSTEPISSILEKQYDFGQVADGTEVVHDFLIKNSGTGVLTITDVKTGWGCTAVSYPRQIPAGGEEKLRIKAQVSKKNGMRYRRVITVMTNDPANPIIELVVTGLIKD